MARGGAAPILGASVRHRRRRASVVVAGAADHHALLAEKRLPAIVVPIRVRLEDRSLPLPQPPERVPTPVPTAGHFLPPRPLRLRPTPHPPQLGHPQPRS